MTVEAAGLLLLLLAAVSGSLLLVLQPLRRQTVVGSSALLIGRDGVLAERKEAALAALLELDRDYRIGNLAESDYRALRVELTTGAVVAMQSLEQREAALDALVEREVARSRGRDAAGSSPREAERTARCVSCGLEHGAADRFCRRCGAPLALPGARPAARAAVAAPAPVPARRSTAPRSAGRWMVAGGTLAVLLVAGVVALYLAAPQRASQAPVGTITAARVGSLAFDPAVTDRLLAGGEAGLLASVDGGATWRPGASVAVVALAWSASEPATLYAGGPAGLTRSRDAGATWEALASAPAGALQALATDPGRPATVYALVAGAGFVSSEDGGTTWTRRSGSPSGDPGVTSLALVPRMGGGPPLLFIGTERQGVLSSSDTGATWGDASGFVNGALPTRRITSLAYDASSGDSFQSATGTVFRGALYAGTDAGLFKSIDGGSSWTRLPLGPGVAVAAVAVSPSDSRRITLVDEQGRVFRSSDRGLTWPGGGQ